MSSAAATETSRRLLRSQYRNVEEDVRSKSDALTTVTSGVLLETLSVVNELQKQVTKPREHALDAGVFCHLTKAGSQATEKLVKSQQGPSAHDFILALRSIYVGTAYPQEDGRDDPSAFDWHRLSNDVASLSKLAPGASCMLGPMDVQGKVRRVAQRLGKRPTGDVVRPEEQTAEQEKQEQETDRNMEEMWTFFQRQPSCPVAELILNHECFAQTVENLFTLSFLVRDSKVYLFQDADQGMMAHVVDKKRPAPAQAGKRPDEQLQFIMAVTMADWETMKRVVKRGDTKMRHRNQANVMALNKVSRRPQRELGSGRPPLAAVGPSSGPSEPPQKRGRRK